MAEEEGGSKVRVFARWPLLLAGLTMMSVGIGIDLTNQASIAYVLWALASACVGAFLYAEGARHREWAHGTMKHKHDQTDNQHEPSEEDTT
jgi:hypothetical protein